jgi:hypothetical protein
MFDGKEDPLGWLNCCEQFFHAQHTREADKMWLVLTDKRCIPLRSASVRTYTLFTTGFLRFLSIHGARGLQAFDLPLHTSYSNPNYDQTRKRLNYTREND